MYTTKTNSFFEFFKKMEELILDGETYTLNQCVDDIYDWFASSKIGEFTRWHSLYIFNKTDGYYATYADNLANGWYV